MEVRIVFHIDFDYFYAQCEEIRQPKLKSKPVCVCVFSDRGGDSGAIATANYTARKYDVKSGMPIVFAKKKLQDREDSVFLPVDFEYYDRMSKQSMELMEREANIFEHVGRDEAFLDVTQRCEGNFQNAIHLAQQIKNTIREKTKLTCSIGISINKLISKIASDYQKPDGLTMVLPDKINEFLEPLDIREIPGIGNKTEKRLLELKIKQISDLKKIDVFTLNKEFGRKTGTFIYNAARGISHDIVKQREESIQYSKIITLKEDSKDYQFISKNLEILCNEVYDILQKNNKVFKSVGINFVQSDLSNKSKTKMLKNPSSSLDELKKNSDQLLKELLETQSQTIRRLGVKVSELYENKGQRNITSFF